MSNNHPNFRRLSQSMEILKNEEHQGAKNKSDSGLIVSI